MAVRLLKPADFRAMPWKNGRGTTTELAREDDADGMLWRLSAADVIEAGDFSVFPGVDRVLMLLDGQGFDLDFGTNGRASVLEPLTPVRFSGDWTTRAENARGRSRDLNLMLARGRAAAEVSVVRDGPTAAPLADRSLFLAVDGSFQVAVRTSDHPLSKGELLVVSDEAGTEAAVLGSGALVRMDIALGRGEGL
jgi:environmental stress-induced protein Ves